MLHIGQMMITTCLGVTCRKVLQVGALGPRQLFAAILERVGRCGWCVPRGEVRRAGQNGSDAIAVCSWCAARADFGG
jgi:hypothetical protein